MGEHRRQAFILALRDAVRLLRAPLTGSDGPLADRAAVAQHEAVGLLLTVGGLRGGCVWWAAVRVVWAAGRLYERARQTPTTTKETTK